MKWAASCSLLAKEDSTRPRLIPKIPLSMARIHTIQNGPSVRIPSTPYATVMVAIAWKNESTTAAPT
jgi:hypothetical protein